MQNIGLQESVPIQSKFLNQSLESAQKKVETYYFDIRKKLFEYEVHWENKSFEQNSWLKEADLVKYNPIYTKVVRMINQKIEYSHNPILHKNS